MTYVKKVDVFPAIIFLAPPDPDLPITALRSTGDRPEGTRKADRCRVTIFNDALYVVQDSPEGPKVVFRERVTEYERTENPENRMKEHHVRTIEGKICVFFKDENCGCGSRLRNWTPFGNMASATGDPDA